MLQVSREGQKKTQAVDPEELQRQTERAQQEWAKHKRQQQQQHKREEF